MKFIIFDELNYIATELPDFSIEGTAELYSEELSQEKIDEIIADLELVYNSFRPGPILTDEGLSILELDDMYWDYMNEVGELMVQAYNGFYEPTYFPPKVLTDSGHRKSVSASSGIDMVYDCDGGGSMVINQIVREDTISPEDAISTLDNVYGIWRRPD
ncbi:MAG: hypothetical protein R3251_04440 [Candidatus Spechtbacterales bacterium]|nr:hypothetical protein [Candidatus Spechtbacterales bacterium]